MTKKSAAPTPHDIRKRKFEVGLESAMKAATESLESWINHKRLRDGGNSHDVPITINVSGSTNSEFLDEAKVAFANFIAEYRGAGWNVSVLEDNFDNKSHFRGQIQIKDTD
jgi:hypothetical protein